MLTRNPTLRFWQALKGINPPREVVLFDKEMRSIKARLSGRKAHAVKVARSLIIEHYLPQLSEAEDLNMSVREAIEAITITCGRCVSKAKLTGLFIRSGDTRYSPFFTDHKYKTSVLSHPVFISLGADIKSLNEAFPSTTNPKHKQLLKQLEIYK
uniref:hypothetical protein n=1 Tax=Vibrio sp. 41 TaxID=65384 RepID=UPI000166004B|nr:hypothetical protein [Vibrio sp. 41]